MNECMCDLLYYHILQLFFNIYLNYVYKLSVIISNDP